jgi:hypothetical protein
MNPAPSQRSLEVLLRSGHFASLAGVLAPRLKQGRRLLPFVRGTLAAIVLPLAEHVLIGKLAFSRARYRVGPLQACGLPCEAARDHPGEYLRPLRAQLGFKFRVGDRWLDDEGQDIEPSPHGFVHIAQRWRVVARDHQLKLRAIGEVVLPHEPRGDWVAAGDCLHLGLSKPAPLFGFARRHQSRAGQHGQLGRMPIVPGLGKRLHRGGDRVIPKDARHGIQEHRFAVSAGAMDECEGVLLRRARQAIAAPALQETDHLGIFRDRFAQEAQPQCWFAVAGGDCRQFGDMRLRPCQPHFACPQIDRSGRCADSPATIMEFAVNKTSPGGGTFDRCQPLLWLRFNWCERQLVIDRRICAAALPVPRKALSLRRVKHC